VLARAADNLYWMARYIERGENMARILDVSYRMSLLPVGSDGQRTLWEPSLIIAGADKAFAAKGLPITPRNVMEHLALDRDFPSSIYSSMAAARENCRAMRVQITTEMWESMNATWLEVRDMTYGKIEAMGPRTFFDWVKERSHLFRGVTYGTMQRDEAFRFVRLGTFLERADSTARLLDVKYHVLLPNPEDVGGALDYYQWGALLRSVSAFRAYRAIYRDVIKPLRVAELLILRADMPRSMSACFGEITEILTGLRELYARDYPSTRLAAQMHSRLRFGRIEDIFTQGLHEYLTEFVDNVIQLSNGIARDFMLIEH
jgi:uncharacterized alpha-E superfamily protein